MNRYTWMLLLALTGPALGQTVKRGPIDKAKKFLAFEDLKSRLKITVTNPPAQKLALDRLVFFTEGGDDARELQDTVTSRFAGYEGASIIDRQFKDRTMDEVETSQSPLVTPEHAIAFGNQKGASAIIIIKLYRIEKEQSHSRSDREDGKTSYTLVTTASLRATVQGIDLATNQVMSAKSISLFESDEKRSDNYDSYPSFEPLRVKVMEKAADEVQKLFIPWTKTLELVFYKDKKFNMKRAYYAMETGDPEYARELMSEGLEQAAGAPNSKTKARAYYNMGLLYFADGNTDKALELLRQADNIDTSTVIRDLQRMIREAKKSRDTLLKQGEKDPFVHDQ